jgi:hypothetical protein
VTLSHYCPTAAGLLDDGAVIAITAEPPAFPAETEIVGLDVRTSLPPSLAPNMLMDWEAWWEWERRAVDTIARPDQTPQQALATLSAAVEAVRGVDAGRRSAPRAHRSRIHARRWKDVGNVRVETPTYLPALSDTLTAIPPDLRPMRIERSDSPSPAVVRAFLAAHAFANWTAHLGHGLRSWLRSLEAALSLVNPLASARRTYSSAISPIRTSWRRFGAGRRRSDSAQRQRCRFGRHERFELSSELVG